MLLSSVFIYLYQLLDGIDELHWHFDMKQLHMSSIIVQKHYYCLLLDELL